MKMPKRAYEGHPLDGTMKYITERDLEDEATKLEAPGEDLPKGNETTDGTAEGLLTKKQRVAKISAEAGITDYQELYDYICSNYNFDTSKSYIYQILNSDVEVEGFELTDDGAKFDNPVADIKQAIIQKARLNPNATHAEIQEEVSESQGVELKYSWVRRVVHRNANWNRVHKGQKKRAITEVFENTRLKGRKLADEVERRKGIEVSLAYIRQLAENGELEGYNDISQEPTKKDCIVRIAEENDTTDVDKVYDLLQEETDITTKRYYVREVLRELKSEENDNSGDSIRSTNHEEVYSRSEIEDKVLNPIASAKQSATEEEVEYLEEFENLVNSMLNEGDENER